MLFDFPTAHLLKHIIPQLILKLTAWNLMQMYEVRNNNEGMAALPTKFGGDD